jgi:NAD(P)-dependent dehydrogenase (short-subunit alcohol dehydrogenase family)
MESLGAEVAPFGIGTTTVNPGFFRTELLADQSTRYAEASIADYDESHDVRTTSSDVTHDIVIATHDVFRPETAHMRSDESHF